MKISSLILSGLKQFSKFMKKDVVAGTLKSYGYCKVASQFGMDFSSIFMYKEAVNNSIKYNLELIKFCIKR